MNCKYSEFYLVLLLALVFDTECGTGLWAIKGWVFHAPNPGKVCNQEEQDAE